MKSQAKTSAKSRILAMLLTVLMVVGLVPFALFATDGGAAAGGNGGNEYGATARTEADLIAAFKSVKGTLRYYQDFEDFTVDSIVKNTKLYEGDNSVITSNIDSGLSIATDGNNKALKKENNSSAGDGSIKLYGNGANAKTDDIYVSVDIKLLEDGYVNQTLFKWMSRGNPGGNIEWDLITLGTGGEIYVAGSKVGNLSNNEYTRIALATDRLNNKFYVYINDISVTPAGATLVSDEKKTAMGIDDVTTVIFSEFKVLFGSAGAYLDNITFASRSFSFSPYPNATDLGTAITAQNGALQFYQTFEGMSEEVAPLTTAPTANPDSGSASLSHNNYAGKSYVQEADGNMAMYIGTGATTGENGLGRFSSSALSNKNMFMSVDLKMGGSKMVAMTLFRAVHSFWDAYWVIIDEQGTIYACDTTDNLKYNKIEIGKLSSTEYTRIAFSTDRGIDDETFKTHIYVNNVKMASVAFHNHKVNNSGATVTFNSVKTFSVNAATTPDNHDGLYVDNIVIAYTDIKNGEGQAITPITFEGDFDKNLPKLVPFEKKPDGVVTVAGITRFFNGNGTYKTESFQHVSGVNFVIDSANGDLSQTKVKVVIDITDTVVGVGANVKFDNVKYGQYALGFNVTGTTGTLFEMAIDPMYYGLGIRSFEYDMLYETASGVTDFSYGDTYDSANKIQFVDGWSTYNTLIDDHTDSIKMSLSASIPAEYANRVRFSSIRFVGERAITSADILDIEDGYNPEDGYYYVDGIKVQREGWIDVNGNSETDAGDCYIGKDLKVATNAYAINEEWQCFSEDGEYVGVADGIITAFSGFDSYGAPEYADKQFIAGRLIVDDGTTDKNGYITGSKVKADGITSFNKANLTLGTSIKLSFWLNITESDGIDENAYIELGRASDFTAKTTLKILLGDAAEVVVGEGTADEVTYRKYTIALSAEEVSTVIYARLVNGDEIGTLYKYSVADYIAAVKADGEASNELKALVTAIEDYGKYADKYVNETDDVLDDITDVTEQSFDASYKFLEETGEESENIEISRNNNKNTFVDGKIRIYLRLKDNPKNYTFKELNKEIEAKCEAGYYILEQEVNIAGYATEFTFTVEHISGESKVIKISALGYVRYYAFPEESNPAESNFMKATYKLYKAVVAYRDSLTADPTV